MHASLPLSLHQFCVHEISREMAKPSLSHVIEVQGGKSSSDLQNRLLVQPDDDAISREAFYHDAVVFPFLLLSHFPNGKGGLASE